METSGNLRFASTARIASSYVGDLAAPLAEAVLRSIDSSVSEAESDAQWLSDHRLICDLENASKNIKVSFDHVDHRIAVSLLKGTWRALHQSLMVKTPGSTLGIVACHVAAAAASQGLRGLRRMMLALHSLRAIDRDLGLIRPLDELEHALGHCRGRRQAEAAVQKALEPYAATSNLAAWVLHGIQAPSGCDIDYHVAGFRAPEWCA